MTCHCANQIRRNPIKFNRRGLSQATCRIAGLKGNLTTHALRHLVWLPDFRVILSTDAIRVAGPSNFEITALMPARRASGSRKSLACMVNRTKAVFGAMEAIFRAASRPFMTGIDRSRITTSGLRALTCSTATAPFSASPQTSQPSRRANHVRSDRRIGRLSSTIRIVVDIRLAPKNVSRSDGRSPGWMGQSGTQCTLSITSACGSEHKWHMGTPSPFY